MRLADIDAWRRRLGRRDRLAAPSLDSAEIKNLPGIEDLVLAPQIGFLAVCGGTGTGKTALLRTIHAGLAPETTGKPAILGPRFEKAEISVQVSGDGEVFARRTPIGVPPQADSDGYPQGALFLGLADRTATPSAFFLKSDIAVLKEGVTPSVMAADDLAAANSISRKDFSCVQVFEVEGPDETVYPFFEVKEDDIEYNSLSLSTGEMSALHIIWALSSANVMSFVFLEEPEAFLPTISHNALFGFLSRIATERRLAVLISTHSSSIASHIERKSILPITRHRGMSRLIYNNESKARTLSRLGLKPTKKAILFVEDELAKSILHEISGLYEFDAVCDIEIVDVSQGAGGIKKALEGLPAGIESVRILGVLDGDMEASAAKWPCLDKLLFLPFRQAAEVEFLKEAESNPKEFGKRLSRSEQKIKDALELSRGDNYHDRYNALPAALGHSRETVTAAALVHWVKRASRKAHVKRFAGQLAKSLGVDLPGEV